MAAYHHQPLCVESSVTGDGGIDVSATSSRDKKALVLHIANTTNKEQVVNLNLQRFGKPNNIKAYSLSGSPDEDNSPDNSKNISPKEQAIKLNGTENAVNLKPFSYTIIICTK